MLWKKKVKLLLYLFWNLPRKVEFKLLEPAEEDANMESIIDPDPPAEKEDLPTLLGHKYVNML